MKKIIKKELPIAMAVLAAFGLMFLFAFSLTATANQGKRLKEQKKEQYVNVEIIEAINVLEDCMEWMDSDVDQGLMEEFVAEIYISRLGEVIKSMEKVQYVVPITTPEYNTYSNSERN